MQPSIWQLTPLLLSKNVTTHNGEVMRTNTVSEQTRNNWLIDACLFLGAMLSSITGIYFLYLPVGGYQGGRNPMHGVTILFQRETWDDLHTWFGLLMIIAALVHIVVHWKWILNMARRVLRELTGGGSSLNVRSRWNVFVNTLTGLSFSLVAVSGVYLFFVPGGRNRLADPMILFSRTTWDLLHAWSGICLILVGILHFFIHWGWVVKVTRKMVNVRVQNPGYQQKAVSVRTESS
jgi:hypothetical protein